MGFIFFSWQHSIQTLSLLACTISLANYTSLQCVTVAVHRSSAPFHWFHNKHPSSSHLLHQPAKRLTSICRFLIPDIQLLQPRSLDHHLHILKSPHAFIAFFSALDAFHDAISLHLHLELSTSPNHIMKLTIFLTLLAFVGLGLAAPTVDDTDLDVVMSRISSRDSATKCDECKDHRDNCLKVCPSSVAIRTSR